MFKPCDVHPTEKSESFTFGRRAILPPLTSSTQVVASLIVSQPTRSTRKSRVPILYVTLATILL